MRKVYRFEILAEVGRAGSNVVYEVRDPLTAVPLHLFEWTPTQEQWQPAAAALADLGDDPHGEVFATNAAFYVAAPTDRVSAALDTLNAHRLFTGSWPVAPSSNRTSSLAAAAAHRDTQPAARRRLLLVMPIPRGWWAQRVLIVAVLLGAVIVAGVVSRWEVADGTRATGSGAAAARPSSDTTVQDERPADPTEL